MSDTRTVLVVEEDPDLRDTIEILLSSKGYRVIATGDGLRAVQLAEQHQIDAALIDLLLPGQSGFQVTTTLKARYDDVKIAVMSGSTSTAHRDYAIAAGAELFITKPFTLTELLDTIASLCPLPAYPLSGIRRTARIGS